jgi:hypothetical protein
VLGFDLYDRIRFIIYGFIAIIRTFVTGLLLVRADVELETTNAVLDDQEISALVTGALVALGRRVERVPPLGYPSDFSVDGKKVTLLDHPIEEGNDFGIVLRESKRRRKNLRMSMIKKVHKPIRVHSDGKNLTFLGDIHNW